MTRALVVIPTYNEKESLPGVLDLVLAASDLDVLVVDDTSPDGTGAIAEAYAARNPRIAVLHRPQKEGLGPAYRAGLRWGLDRGYEILVEMDADLSHDPADLPRLVAATADADLVIGSRYVPGGAIENWPRHRLILSSGGNRYVHAVTGIPVRDATSGFRAFRAPLLEELDLKTLQADGYSFQLETALRSWREGFRITEVPITFVERRAGASKISRSIVFEAMWRVLQWGVRGPRRAGAPHPRSMQTPAA